MRSNELVMGRFAFHLKQRVFALCGALVLLACSDGNVSPGDASASGGGGTSTGSAPGAGGSTAGIGGASGGQSAASGGSASGGAPSASGGSGIGGAQQNGSGGTGVPAGGTGSGGTGSGGTGSGGTGSGGTGSGEDPEPSAGCGKAPTLNSTSSGALDYNNLASGRRYVLRLPSEYDNSHAYRLILGFHGATGNANEVVGSNYFGLVDRAEDSTIFIAAEAVGGFWSLPNDLSYVDDILAEVKADLCIDQSRVELEGFSMGAAMVFNLMCARPGVFRAVAAHSGGGLPVPQTCEPVAYFSSLGQQENTNPKGQAWNSDHFAQLNGCTIESLPSAPTGGHLCSDYQSCSTGHPTRWCPFDGGHTPAPKDSGQSESWMPDEVWQFLSQF